MARPREAKILVADFETTVYDGQDHTEVWAAACVELYSEDVKIFHSLPELYSYMVNLDTNIICYFHNLKFDGSFWLDYLMNKEGYTQGFNTLGSEIYNVEKIDPKKMGNKQFNYSISDMGQWYTISIKINRHIIELRDSLKLLPFSVSKIGKSFGTKHKKLDMEYKGLRYAGCVISDTEREYIANDVLVIKEALEIMYDEGHTALTIGSCCLAEYKRLVGKKQYENWFPDMYEIELDPNVYGSPNAGEYIRKSYKGGWCYLVRGKENQIKHNGTTADVNSLYPSMMHSESGNLYPVGKPTFWSGNYIPFDQLTKEYPGQTIGTYFFVRVRTRFYLNDGFLPFIQIKNNLMYKGTEMLESSDILDHETGLYYNKYTSINGEIKSTALTLTLTQTDYWLFLRHYDVVEFEILDGCYFRAYSGIFDDYIDKYRKIKMESKGARRELAKLFLNNLYGKMASSKDSSFKYAYLKPDNSVGFVSVHAADKKPGYIPVGSAITSYARRFTITAAQLNYHGPVKPGFIYADTDSIHCDLHYSEIQGIKVDPNAFCCWKLESSWDTALFVRQKTYIEHITHEDCTPIEKPYYAVRCAGMPERCKNLFLDSVAGITHANETDKYSEYELEFLAQKREITDFKIGLMVPGKLMPRRIPGGTLLVETSYQMR